MRAPSVGYELEYRKGRYSTLFTSGPLSGRSCVACSFVTLGGVQAEYINSTGTAEKLRVGYLWLIPFFLFVLAFFSFFRKGPRLSRPHKEFTNLIDHSSIHQTATTYTAKSLHFILQTNSINNCFRERRRKTPPQQNNPSQLSTSTNNIQS